MKMKLMLAATAIAALTGASYAQESGVSGMSKNAPEAGEVYMSPNEQAFYEDNADVIAVFFTDETMTEMVTEEEMQTAWTGLTEEQRGELRADCDEAGKNRADYGETSRTLCSQLGAFE